MSRHKPKNKNEQHICCKSLASFICTNPTLRQFKEVFFEEMELNHITDIIIPCITIIAQDRDDLLMCILTSHKININELISPESGNLLHIAIDLRAINCFRILVIVYKGDVNITHLSPWTQCLQMSMMYDAINLNNDLSLRFIRILINYGYNDANDKNLLPYVKKSNHLRDKKTIIELLESNRQ